MRILLGITGGIAAYKSAELVRLLQKRDYDVFVAMTRNAQRFITPLTLATLSGHRVMTDMYAEEEDPGMDVNIEHIRVAASVDLLLWPLRQPISWPNLRMELRTISFPPCFWQARF